MSSVELTQKEWVERFSQIPLEDLYFNCSFAASSMIDFSNNLLVCVFNCSDGPSTKGLIDGILSTSPHANFVVSDISLHATQACLAYLHRSHPDMYIPFVDCDSTEIAELLNKNPHLPNIDTYISFEPIGEMEKSFEEMMNYLPVEGKLVICSRGPLDKGLNTIAQSRFRKHPQFAYKVHDTGLQTNGGPVIAAELVKVA